MSPSDLLLSIATLIAATLISAATTWAILPVLSRYTLAKPNARSSHRVPTPQGAGLAVIAATLAVAGVVIACFGATDLQFPAEIFGASLLMTMVGFADDIKTIPVLPRLLLQALAVGVVIFAVPGDWRIFSSLPLGIERGLLLLAGLWFVNLVNFMDGLDWMTVAEVVPVTLTLVLLGLWGELPFAVTILAAALGGAMIGFAPLNRPVAKLFLGDVGSLPIGLLLGWCLLPLVYRHHYAAAFLLPLYYLADATLTLLRRLIAGERVWVAHRSHFYQRATDGRFAVISVVREVFTLNVCLAALAIASIVMPSLAANVALVAVGCLAVGFVLRRFTRLK